MNKQILALASIALLTSGVFADEKPATRWTAKDVFEQKVFIENKGQYSANELQAKDLPVQPGTEILYSALQDGMQYYFTKNAVYIRYTKMVKRSHREVEALMKNLNFKEEEGGEEEEKEGEFAYKGVEQFHVMEFLQANESASILAENSVKHLYNFCPNQTPISALGYKKLTYKNLYPGIDMEFYFPEDKQGFKYNFLAHPGADPSQIKIQFPLNKKTGLTEAGDLQVKSAFGMFTDHAPVANSSNGNLLDCSFQLTKEILSFSLGKYDATKELVIDPWTTTPVFVGNNKAYDVDWDYSGNCYVYGGKPHYQVIKFDASGNQLWSYTTSFVPNSGGLRYGDFAVDRRTQSVYIVDGFNTAAQIIKLNAAGTQIGITAGNANFQEIWRIIYNSCTNQAIVAGGGTTSPSYGGGILDTMLNFTPVNVLNSPTGLHDMWGVAADASGNAYFATVATLNGTGGYDNKLYKVPVPLLAPISWTASTNYVFTEVSSTAYVSGGCPNGYNGMTCSSNFLYTYDSNVLKRWDMGSGSMLGSLAINGQSQSSMPYGGLSTDECDHLFVGSHSTIKQYNGTTFSLVNTFALSSDVLDVMLGANNILYACGDGFVTAIQVNLVPCSPPIVDMIQKNNPTCNSSGSATVTVTSGGIAPFTYIWSNGQTGPVASNLTGGTYTVTIKDSKCPPEIKIDTITITPFAGAIIASTTAPLNVKCNGGNTGKDSVTVSGGVSPYTYSWNNGQTTAIATNLAAGSYTCTVTDAMGCKDTAVVQITQPLPMQLSFTTTPVNCNLNDGSAAVNANGGASPYSYVWSNAQTTQTISNLASAVYSVTVTDSNLCAQTQTVSVSSSGTIPLVDHIGVQEYCPDQITQGISFTSNPGGVGSTFYWTNLNTAIGLGNSGTGNIPSFTTVNTSSVAITATILVHAAYNGCTGPDSLFTFIIDPKPVANFSTQLKICTGTSMAFADHSTGSISQWNWDMDNNGSINASTQNPAYVFTVPGTHSVTLMVSTNKNCRDTVSEIIYANPLPAVGFTADHLSGCPLLNVNFTDHSIIQTPGQITSWQWNFGNGQTFSGQFPGQVSYSNASQTQNATYSVSLVVTSDSGCSVTMAKPNYITVYPRPKADFTYTSDNNESDGLDPTVHFQDQSQGGNTIYWYLGDVFSNPNSVNYTYAHNPSHTYLHEEVFIYYITQWVSNSNGCKDSITKPLEVKPGYAFYIPNAFTPDGNGLNEGFKGTGIGIDNSTYKLLIFDRWGNQIFEGHNLETAWDGRTHGKEDAVQEDVYVWKAEFKDLSGKQHEYKGTVTVVR